MIWFQTLLSIFFKKNPTLTPVKKKHKSYDERVSLSPNKGGKIKPKFIILHHSYGSFAGGVSWILQKVSKVSYHYLIDSDGSRVQFVWDSIRAWHAGRSKWGSYVGLNAYSVSIAFWGNTHEREVSFDEIDSCAEKCVYLMDKFSIPVENILSHRQIAPTRKNDPSNSVMERVKQRIEERQSHDTESL